MSYDINFWRQPAGYPLTPEETYTRLSRGEQVNQLLDLPVEEILEELKKILPDFDKNDKFPLAHTESQERNQDGSVEPIWSQKHFRFDLRGEATDAFNQLTALMARYECPLYDPQEDKRYATPDGTGVAEVPRQEPMTEEQKAEVERIKEQFLAGIRPDKQRRGCGTSLLVLFLMLVSFGISYMLI